MKISKLFFGPEINKFKQSYTLVELSMVILVLSSMMGTLMVGKNIIDRARMQRVIYEFIYYEKSFHQFYDTYKSVPGSLNYRKCSKRSVFVQYKNTKYNNFCNCIAVNEEQLVSDRIIYGWLNYSLYSVVSQLYTSRLIDKKPKILGEYQEDGDFCPYSSSSIGNKFLIGHWNTNTGTALQASFDHNAWIQITGYNFSQMELSGETMEHYKRFANANSNTYFNGNAPHEFDDKNFLNELDQKNAIILYSYNEGFSFDFSEAFSSGKLKRTQVGVLNSLVANHIDIKFDDGRPGSGRILALKSGNAHYDSIEMREHMKHCYDRRADKVSEAYYNDSTDRKYGCNLIWVLNDVRR